MTTFSRRTLFTSACGLALALSSTLALAAPTVVKVSLWDKGAMSMKMLSKAPHMGMAMQHGHGMPSGGPMGITLSTDTVPAGEVTFAVSNDSKDMVHEMVLAPVKNEKKPLPYVKKAMKVDEDAAGHLGEVAELEPGANGALTLTLKPGKYILYCNIAGHYTLGMWTLLTVQ
jgi:uncharacterized cupredoxin-like copper-binding protein